MLKKIVPFLLTLLLTLPAFAQIISPQDQKAMAIATMAMTPLARMDKDSAMLIAATSYECASFFIGMTVMAEQMNDLEQLPDTIDLKAFTGMAQRTAQYHIGLSEIIHIIYDITEEQDLAIMMKQNAKVGVAVTNLTTDELDTKYAVQCKAILKTYLPKLFDKGDERSA